MKQIRSMKGLVTVGLMAAGVALTGCDVASDGPTGLDPTLAIGDYSFNEEAIDPGIVRVCSFLPDDNSDGESRFEASATGGDVISGDFVIGYLPNCIEIWNSTDGSAVDVTATLLESADDDLVLDRVVTLVGDGPVVTTYPGAMSGTVAVSDLIGASIWFKFTTVDAPSGGGEGCTPGYWRQSHHFDSWTAPYDPSDSFESAFGVDAFPGQTLLDVVWARGGGLNALGRQAVAALLSAASDGVDYDYTVAEVIDAFAAAFLSGDSDEIEGLKNRFDFLNNQGCGLD